MTDLGISLVSLIALLTFGRLALRDATKADEDEAKLEVLPPLYWVGPEYVVMVDGKPVVFPEQSNLNPSRTEDK